MTFDGRNAKVPYNMKRLKRFNNNQLSVTTTINKRSHLVLFLLIYFLTSSLCLVFTVYSLYLVTLLRTGPSQTNKGRWLSFITDFLTLH